MIKMSFLLDIASKEKLEILSKQDNYFRAVTSIDTLGLSINIFPK